MKKSSVMEMGVSDTTQITVTPVVVRSEIKGYEDKEKWPCLVCSPIQEGNLIYSMDMKVVGEIKRMAHAMVNDVPCIVLSIG